MDKNKLSKAEKIINNPNTRLFAVSCENAHGFSVYLDISGQYEFIMFHRSNKFLYNLLKDGIRLSELRRWTPSYRKYIGRRKNEKTKKAMIDHLIRVTDEFIVEELLYNPTSTSLV